MLDGYGREIDYLRISITDKCNLRCRYCMPEDIESLPMSEILTYEEIVYISETAAELGIRKIKITGGEPLVRKGCSKLVRMLKEIPGIEQVTLTTNGVLLSEYMSELADAGIDAINISIDTLDEEKYRLITGADSINSVIKGLDAALNSGIRIKINAVSVDWSKFAAQMRGETVGNEGFADACALIDLASEQQIDVRFIEIMPIGFGKGFPAVKHDVLIPAIKERYKGLVRDEARQGNGPAVYYRIPGYKGRIGFISAIHGMFCNDCNRIRLTTRGYLKGCLCYDAGADLKDIIRGGMPDEEKKQILKSKIRDVILCKPKSHSFEDEKRISEKHVMSEIGG